MKNIVLLIVLVGSVYFASGQATINCFTGSDDYHTGSTNGTDFTQTSLIKTQSSGVEAGWARFDISGIPTGSTVQTVELNIFVSEDNNAYWQVMSMEEDPLLGTAANVYADCTDGDIYALWQGDFPQPSWYITDLGAEAVADVQDQMDEGWFGISMWEFETGGTWAITCDGWNEDNPPFIVVTYLVPGAPLPPTNPYPPHNSFSVDVEADLSWDFGDATETYDLFFGTDFPPSNKVVDNATSGVSGTYDPGILEFTTTYYWQVIAKNSAAELETPGPIWTFTTACDAWAVPFYEDVETTTPPELPYCWTGIANSVTGNALVQVIPWNGVNDSQCITLENSDDPNAEVLLITPQIEGGAAGKYINFLAWGYAPVSVGTIADPADPSTYSEQVSFTLSTNWLSFEEFEVFFTNYTGNDEYIALKLLNTDWYQGIYVDNILVDVAPTCPKPTGLYSTNATTTSVDLGWTENGSATQWNIEWGLFGFSATGVPNEVTNDNPFTLTGLQPSTTYEFYVQADCGGGDESLWVGPHAFQTDCDVTTVPYIESFEGIIPPDIPSCIIVENTNGDNNTWYSTNDASFIGNNSIRINYTCANEMDDWFFSAPLNLTGGETYIVQFYYTSNSSFYLEQLEVKWGAEAASSAMTEGPIFVDENINYAFEWYEGTGYFTPATDGVYYVGWHGYSIVCQYNLYVDDIIIDVAPTCLKPSDLYAGDATANSVTVGWYENGEATQWNIEYGYEGFSPTGTPTVVADSNPFEITDLEAGTSYDFYVQADCGDGDVSWWAGPENFVTLCDPIDVPIEENFDLVITPALPDCWRVVMETTGNSGVTTIPFNALSFPNALEIENGSDPDAEVVLISPPLSESKGAADKWVRFYAWGYAGELAIGTISNPYDPTTFNPVSVVTLSANYLDYQEYEVYFTNYTGDDQFIAFKPVVTATYQTVYIDDVIIDHPPTCPKPTDLFASNMATSSVMLNWQENGEAATWNIEYGYAGFSPSGIPTLTVTENPFEITGLEPGTVYDYYIQADCGGGDLSEWSNSDSFTTLCEAFDVPVMENFDGVVAPELPTCWTPVIESTSIWAVVETFPWDFYSGPNSLHFYNSGDPNAEIIIVSPLLVDPVDELWINFFAFGWAPELIIGTITDPLDASTFTPYETVSLSFSWLEYEVFFDDYTGTDMFIALKAGIAGAYQDVFLDDITIDHPPTCPKPDDLYAEDASTNSIMLGWTENGDATQWNIEYGYAGFNPTGIGNAVADSNPFELTGLEDGTGYEYYVQADCGSGDVSYWVGPRYFQTLCFPVVLAEGEYFEDFEDLTPPIAPPCITIEDGNFDDITWQSSFDNPNSGLSHMRITWNNNLPMDDWFFTAPLELLGGQTYNVQFYYGSFSDFYFEKMEVRWGDGPSADDMTDEVIFDDNNIATAGAYLEGNASFTAPEDGTYFVGFHGYSDPFQWDLYVDDIFIEWDNSLVVSATAEPDSICQGEETTLVAAAVGGSGSYTISWTSDPPGFTSNDPEPTVMPDETTDYILEINDGFVSIYDTVTVFVTPLPSIPGTPNGLTFFCASWGTATYSTSGASGANWYDWVLEPEDAGTLSGTGTSVSVNWSDGWLGNATLTVTGMHNDCAGPPSTNLSIMVYLPDVSFELVDTVGMNWSAFELTGGDPPGGEYSGPGVEDGWFDPAVAGLGDHTITYTYTDPGTCENSADELVTVVQFVGLDASSNHMKVSVIPNPNNGVFTLTIKSGIKGDLNLQVMNSFGETVLQEEKIDLEMDYSSNIDLSRYSKGLYYLYIYSEDIHYVEKIVVK